MVEKKEIKRSRGERRGFLYTVEKLHLGFKHTPPKHEQTRFAPHAPTSVRDDRDP